MSERQEVGKTFNDVKLNIVMLHPVYCLRLHVMLLSDEVASYENNVGLASAVC